MEFNRNDNDYLLQQIVLARRPGDNTKRSALHTALGQLDRIQQ